MKILIWHRGPVRPSSENCIQNMKLLKSDFETDFEIEELISAYTHPLANEVFINYKVNYFLLMDAPSDLFIKSIIPKSHVPSGAEMHRVFKQYYTNKIISEFIFNLKKYDFVIMSRMDTKFSIKSNFKDWFNYGKYTTIHVKTDGWTNDQFGIAEPEIMKKAWDYKTIEILKEFINKAHKAEDILDQIIEMNNVETYSMRNIKLPDIWLQDPNRGNIIV